ncbi:MAG: putative NEK protein kinase [Streblomastix strix]|uniref:non-specific serine/threonine protein kinase n=1 Tax=Streblomastix strix TaxID=222440 RepID=A0A5J4VWG3_9EUKA|nr:MAG: putative NEK protein kinase [Streblomastix strix]
MTVKNFTFQNFIGKGSYGEVHQVLRNADGKVYALKQINIKFVSQRDKQDSMNEIRILASIVHPNIIRYREAFFEDDKLFIITEFVDNGDLQQRIKAARTARRYFCEDIIWTFFLQIC